jgi:hypothetical protein
MFQVSLGSAISRHATKRCQQRGVSRVVLSTLLDHWDRSVPVGGGLTAVTLSRKEAVRLRTLGHPSGTLDRLSSLAAILSPDGQVVTVLHATDPRYRRTRH